MRYTMFAQSKHTRNTFQILDSFWPGLELRNFSLTSCRCATKSPDVVVSVGGQNDRLGEHHQQKTCLFSFISLSAADPRQMLSRLSASGGCYWLLPVRAAVVVAIVVGLMSDDVNKIMLIYSRFLLLS